MTNYIDEKAKLYGDVIYGLKDDFVKVDEMKSHGHMCAAITDAIFMTSMDYENVVQPRLEALKKQLAEIEADMEQYFAPYQK